MKWLRILIAAVVVSSAGPASAAGPRLVFHPQETEIRFTLGATLHTVEGTALLDHGEVLLDLDDSSAHGEMVVDARSATTGNAKRDRKMHRQVLRSEEFPRIVLAPTSWESELDLTSACAVTVHGRFELLGETHEVEVPVRLGPEKDGVVVDLTLEVPYVKWGLENPSTFVLRVAKSVTVEVHAVAVLAAEPPPSMGQGLGVCLSNQTAPLSNAELEK